MSPKPATSALPVRIRLPKRIFLALLLWPLAVLAQDPAASMEAQLQRLEQMKAKMPPEQRKQFEASGVEQQMRDALAKMRQVQAKLQADQEKQEQSAQASALQTAGKGPNRIPDAAFGGARPEAPTSQDKLIASLKALAAESAKVLDAADRTGMADLLKPGSPAGQWAMIFWTNGELGKALYLLSHFSLGHPDDFLALNNLGALLTLSGCAEKSLPLLLYAQMHGPESSTLLNNVGQAWLSLGYLEEAQAALEAAVAKDPDNAEAQHSLALLAAKRGDVKACVAHIQQAVAGGAATPDNLTLLQQAAPEVDIPALIRPRFRQFYKDRTITKRFPPPAVPASYAEAVSRRDEIETYLKNLSATAETARQTAGTMGRQFQQTLLQSMGQLQSSGQNPLRLQASLMIANLDNPRYSTSYQKRLQRAVEDRKAAEAAEQKSLAKYGKEIAALRQESGRIEGGEGDIEGEKRLEEIRLKICALTQERQAELLAAGAQSSTQYLHDVEDLLNQRLQEQTFWTAVMFSPLDVSTKNYEYYAAYLQDLSTYVRPAYPDPSQLSAPCKDPKPTWANIAGQPQSWEMNHCDLDIGVDLGVVAGKMDCTGWKIRADLEVGEFEYQRSVDPVTWETTGHSISAKAGREKEFNLGRNLGGKVEADVKTTMKFDANLNPVDLVVEATASASVNGPMGSSASANLGQMEVSVNGGFNSSGPAIPGF